MEKMNPIQKMIAYGTGAIISCITAWSAFPTNILASIGLFGTMCLWLILFLKACDEEESTIKKEE